MPTSPGINSAGDLVARHQLGCHDATHPAFAERSSSKPEVLHEMETIKAAAALAVAAGADFLKTSTESSSLLRLPEAASALLDSLLRLSATADSESA